jgi:NADH-quinone oxidoreductase subunit J
VTLFVLFGAVALGAAVGMLFQRNAIHAALLLVVNLLAVAVLFLTLGAEFLFVAQIIVYAGAIVVLFLFVIMLLGVDREEVISEPRRFQTRQGVLGGLAAVILVAALFGTLGGARLLASLPPTDANFGSAQSIGTALFSTYLLPFEVTGLLLLVATIGILMLAKREPR